MIKSRLLITTVYLVIAAVVITGVYLAINHERQNIYDWIALRGYKPPSAIATIASEDGMTAYTKRVFYINHPKIEPKTSFADECPNDSEQMVVLGCYHLGQQGIYLLSVNNSQLYGIEQVTAAYETLHAIYQRLSSSEQDTLNSELLNFEHHGLNNKIVEAQIAGFKITEPTGVLNEMTSLFGTEVQNLPPALSQFYAKYFTNRQTLLNYYDNYQEAFTTREQEITSYNSLLSSLNSQIKTDETQLNQEKTSINSQEAVLNSEKNSGNIDEYNAGVPGYNQQVNAYNSLVGTVSSLVNQYNQIVGVRNSIALEEQQLVQTITSSNKPIAN